jgi:hypothetical protein
MIAEVTVKSGRKNFSWSVVSAGWCSDESVNQEMTPQVFHMAIDVEWGDVCASHTSRPLAK